MADRKLAERRGRRAETLAALALLLKGYSIIARRVRNSGGEVDLIARRGNLIVFIEVKARKNHELAVEAVTPKTQRRIVRAAVIWAARQSHFANCDWRFDVVTVVPYRWPKHLKDAWRPDASNF